VSAENVAIVRGALEGFNSGDPERILPFLDPDFVATTPSELASEPDTYRGHDGIRRYFESFEEVMEDIRWDLHDFHEAGDRVLVEFTLRARGKTTGLDFGQPAVMLWELRDGRAIRLDLFSTLDEARAAADGASS
jgi:uncharacterized protein